MFKIKILDENHETTALVNTSADFVSVFLFFFLCSVWKLI
jgi:hypothetical protein